jgi:presenilin-like A22 family membrane protease
LSSESKKTKKNYYAGVGMLMGTGMAGALMITLFSLTRNAMFIPFIGAGTAIGLIIGAGMDAKRAKGKT